MAAKLTLGPFEVDLERLVGIVRDLVSVELNQDAKDSVMALIIEVKKVYDDIINSLMPFYDMIDDKIFQKEFAIQFSKFKGTFLKNIGEIDFHCTAVQNQLKKLSEDKNWLKRVPLLRNRIKDFNESADIWFTRDSRVYDNMNKFYHGLVNDLDSIYSAYDQTDITVSRKKLLTLLTSWDGEFLSIKMKIDELRALSRQL